MLDCVVKLFLRGCRNAGGKLNVLRYVEVGERSGSVRIERSSSGWETAAMLKFYGINLSWKKFSLLTSDLRQELR